MRKGRVVLQLLLWDLAKGSFHPITYSVLKLDKLIDMPIEEGLVTAKAGYNRIYVETHEDAFQRVFYKAAYAVFIRMVKRGEEADFAEFPESIEAEFVTRKLSVAIMDTTSYLTKWADAILAAEGEEMK